MLRVAHASHNGTLYVVDLRPPDGIVELVRDTNLETCTTADRIVFWFTRSTNRAFMFPNVMATELLLATTEFTARDVPILRGNIVITGRDGAGEPAALTTHQFDMLKNPLLSTHAHDLAMTLLATALPTRWAHTIGVATTARQLAHILDPDNADRIEAAAWLHDIGYAPTLVHTGFHPIDGATYLQRTTPTLTEITSLVAHHTGARFEAHQRGLTAELARYPHPTHDIDLAILNCADLCTGPHGDPVNPDARLTEVLHRYPPEHPVHQAITRSGPLLCAQAHLVLDAASQRRNSLSANPTPHS